MKHSKQTSWLKRLGRGLLHQILLVAVFFAPFIVFNLLRLIFPKFRFSTAYMFVSLIWIFGAMIVYFARKDRAEQLQKSKDDDHTA